MLSSQYDVKFLETHLTPLDQWRPFPPASDRDAWQALLDHPINKQRRAYWIETAESMLGKPWPELPATLMMEFIRSGNRRCYENPYFERRDRLSTLVVAECFDHQGRFLDDIVNGLWLICEESTWAISAHVLRRDHEDPLPQPGPETLALFSLQTALLLAEAVYMLADQLDEVSTVVRQRVYAELHGRVIENFEQRTDDELRWLDGHNNWTPWCASGLLGCAMYVVDDLPRLAAVAHRLMAAVDRFVDGYGDDGGCDEGPGYWSVAAGTMLLFLEFLRDRTGGAVDIYNDPIIRQMGEYITRVHLAGPWFANPSDASARVSPPRAITYRYGQRIGSQAMQTLVAAEMRGWASDLDSPVLAKPNRAQAHLPNNLRELFWLPAKMPAQPVRHPLEVWLPDLQVAATRDSTDDGVGLVCVAKAGHNAENHNHNDLGQFILVLDGNPVVIDVGTEFYRRETFRDKRYTLWTHRSDGHNVPRVNGYEQAAGRQYAASGVAFSVNGCSASLVMDLAGAYPSEAGLIRLRRQVVHQRDTRVVTVTDAVVVGSGPVESNIPLYTPSPPAELASNVIQLGCGARKLHLTVEPGNARIAISDREIADERLQGSWGPRLYRVDVTFAADASELTSVLRFAVAE